MYASFINDIVAFIPFSLDENSLPTENNAQLIHKNINRFINGLMGRSIDVPGNDKDSDQPNDPGLRWLEIDLTINAIMEIHEGRAYNTPILMPEHMKVLNQYMGSNIKFKELKFGRE